MSEEVLNQENSEFVGVNDTDIQEPKTEVQSEVKQEGVGKKNPLYDLAKKETTNDTKAVEKVSEERTKTVEPFAFSALKIPEGVSVDDGAKGELEVIAKDLGLNTKQVQGLMDLNFKVQQQAIEKYFDEQQSIMSKMPLEDKQLAISGIKRFIPADQHDVYLGEDSVMTPAMMGLAIALGRMGSEGKHISNSNEGGRRENGVNSMYADM